MKRPYLIAAACIAALIVTLIAVPTADARCFRVSYGYRAPVYRSYSYNYVPVYNNVHHDNVVIVPKAFKVAVALDSYTSVGDEYRQAYFAKLVAEELAKLQQQAQPPAVTQPNGGHAQQLQQPKIAAVLAANCTRCHKAGGDSPDLSGDPETIPELVRLKSVALVSARKMPKDGKAVPDNDYDELVYWSLRKPVIQVGGPLPLEALEKKPKAVLPPAIPKAKE